MKLKIFCDGGARGNPGLSAWAFLVFDEQDRILAQKSEKMGVATNNVAEYTAVIKSLEWLKKNRRGKDLITFYLDSELVVSQLNGLYKVKNSRLRELVFRIRQLESETGGNIFYQFIPREKNYRADYLVNQSLDSA